MGFAPIGVALLAGLGCALLLACQPDRQSPRPTTYVALGASDAVGVGTASPATEGWVPRLGQRLGPNARTINLGVSGSTLRQALDEQLGPALDARPTLVTVWLVVNDINARVALESYARDLDTLLGALRGSGARVLVANVPDLPRVGVYAQADAELLRQEIARWNAAIAATVDRHGADLVDLHANWRELAEHPEYVSADGFHPSAEGYARVADLFYQVYDRTP